MYPPNRVPCLLCAVRTANGQLERALEIWRDMAARGCERNVITYSSLISACEKSGRWQLALDLFAEMHREGCKPNVVRTRPTLTLILTLILSLTTTPTLIAEMHREGCKPNMVRFLPWTVPCSGVPDLVVGVCEVGKAASPSACQLLHAAD